MADEHVQSAFDVRGLLWQHVPADMPPALVDGLGEYLWERSARGVVMRQEDWPFAVRDLCRALESVGGVPELPPSEAELDQVQQEIHLTDQAALLALLRQMVPTVPPPPNTFNVGVHGDYVWVARPFTSKLSKADALSLAVWLAYLADPEMATFLPLLQAVVEK